MNVSATFSEPVSGVVRIIHSTGLHARPSVMFTRLAKSFDAVIVVADNPHGPWIDAKSIIKVMGMKVPFGTMLHIRATGRDAKTAIGQLSCLVENDFDGSQKINDAENAR